jgi:patatin-related protein
MTKTKQQSGVVGVPAAASAAPPLFSPISEVRFAVVMYGGVSLAIYMNGITQELLRMVRATAPASRQRDNPHRALLSENELCSSEKVYRRIGQLLNGNRVRASDIAVDDPISSRFVVDILSGTSAGGINGIYLAKALANNQSIDDLTTLWKEEADFARLLNDSQSRSTPGLLRQHPPQSLLNSQRMYRLLLTALQGMERARPSSDQSRSPLVEELDLFVTTTDIEGLTLPLRLADKVVEERRHRNVFHFLYATAEATGDDRNDFWHDNDPFLAFAGRCTSAFPYAFEPMQLSDIDEVLASDAEYQNQPQLRSGNPKWKGFYKDYCEPQDPTASSFCERSFGDGGYLDNKPFSYATETVTRRRADQPVERKLIYIEPSPEHPELEPASKAVARPDVLKNVEAALFILPRYETIREDLQRVQERNRLIGQIQHALAGNERDVAAEGPRTERTWKHWEDTDLAVMIREKGPSYGVYHRLKVATLTDELAELLTRLAGLDEASDEFRAIRNLVRAWREKNYVDYKDPHRPNVRTENYLLFEFDLSYRLRRLNFLFDKIDELSRPGEQAQADLKYAGIPKDQWPTTEQYVGFQQELREIRYQLNTAFVLLRRAGRHLRATEETNPLWTIIQSLELAKIDLAVLLKSSSETGQLKAATSVYHRYEGVFEQLASEIADTLKKAFTDARQTCADALGIPPSTGSPLREPNAEPPPRDESVAKRCLRHYYEYYDDYDAIIFPIKYGTDLGEVDPVDVIRISPEDATRIRGDVPGKPSKLAGAKVFHFGAFLDRSWRENDILWGRLDGAERIITTLLGPDHPDLDHFIDDAHLAILKEEISAKTREELCQVLAKELTQRNIDQQAPQAVHSIATSLGGISPDPMLLKMLSALMNAPLLLDLLKHNSLAVEHLPPQTVWRDSSRAVHVTGEMLEDLADRHQLARKPAKWLAWLGSVLVGIVEVSIPGSPWHMLWHHTTSVLYVAELAVIAIGIVFSASTATRSGIIALVVTLLLDVLIWSLRRRLGANRLAGDMSRYGSSPTEAQKR